MKSFNTLFLAGFAVIFISCDDKEKPSGSVDLRQLEENFAVNRDGRKFVQIKRYINSCRVIVSADDGSEVTIVLDENCSVIDEIFVVKSVEGSGDEKNRKKFISINNSGELEVVEKE